MWSPSPGGGVIWHVLQGRGGGSAPATRRSAPATPAHPVNAGPARPLAVHNAQNPPARRRLCHMSASQALMRQKSRDYGRFLRVVHPPAARPQSHPAQPPQPRTPEPANAQIRKRPGRNPPTPAARDPAPAAPPPQRRQPRDPAPAARHPSAGTPAGPTPAARRPSAGYLEYPCRRRNFCRFATNLAPPAPSPAFRCPAAACARRYRLTCLLWPSRSSSAAHAAITPTLSG